MCTKDEGRETEKLFNFRPVFFAALFLAFGIVFYFLYHYYKVSALWLLALIPLAGMPFFFCKSKEKIVQRACAIVCLGIFFFAGFLGFALQTNEFSQMNDYVGQNYITGRVIEKRVYNTQIACILDNVKIGGKLVKGKLIAYLPTSFEEEITLSDEIFLEGQVSVNEIGEDNFSYMAGELGNKIYLRVWSEKTFVTGHKFDLFLFLRARAEQIIDAGMGETPAAVTKAVLFGNTEGIDEDLLDNVRKGGIAHIFAVSGLHVGALFGFCLLLLKKTALCRFPKWARFALLAVLLFIYAGICGFSASVVRATVICLAAYLATLLGTKTDFIESLGLAAICILLLKPSALFEVGFQLSFMACFGIAFLSKPIGQVFDELQKCYRLLFPREPTPAEIEAAKNDDTLPLSIGARVYRAIATFLSASLGAQIFTAPLQLFYFGYVSGWALLLNCIFVPLIGAVFSILLLLVVIACLLPIEFAFIILYVPNVVWSVILLLFQTMDFYSFAISGLTISVGASIAYYGGWVFLTDKWNLKKSFSFLLAILCFLAFVVTMVALNI